MLKTETHNQLFYGSVKHAHARRDERCDVVKSTTILLDFCKMKLLLFFVNLNDYV